MEFKNKHKIQKLKELIQQELTPLIDKDYALVDFPNYKNIGDNLIWQGEIDYLKDLPYKKSYSANVHTYRKENMPSDCVILLQGGGNFGDLYPALQNLRLDVIQNFPGHKIIMFPQTVYYKDEKLLEKHAKIFNNHNQLTLCARDQVSYDLITKYVNPSKIKMLPDMAFCMDLTKYHKEPTSGKNLYMERIDSEKNHSYTFAHISTFFQNDNEIEIKDWPTYSMNSFVSYFTNKLHGLESKISKNLIKTPILKSLIHNDYGLKSKGNLEKYILMGINFINTYDKIATTRLHGFILSVLLNKEVGIVDNSYGKNSNFYNTWMQDFYKISLIQK